MIHYRVSDSRSGFDFVKQMDRQCSYSFIVAGFSLD